MGPEFAEIQPWLEKTWAKAREEGVRASRATLEQGTAKLAARGLYPSSGAALTLLRETTTATTREVTARWLTSLAQAARQTFGRLSTEFLADARAFYVQAAEGFDKAGRQTIAEAYERQGLGAYAGTVRAQAHFAFARDFDIEFGADLIKAKQIVQPPPRSVPDTFEYDVFVSHASEDKPTAIAIAHGLAARGLRVWMDYQQITIGDSIFKKVNDGLARSRYGVVLLSPSFFKKGWTQQELGSLASRAYDENTKVLLPVRLGLTQEQVRANAPLLGDILSGSCDDMPALIDDLSEAVMPPPKG